MYTRSKTAAAAVVMTTTNTPAAREPDEDGAVKELLVQLQHTSISFTSTPVKEQQRDATSVCPPVPTVITDIPSFHQVIVDLINRVYNTLGDAQLEKTYQRALLLELRKLYDRGVRVLEELSIPIRYDGEVIGTRRADLVVLLPDGSRCILELKAVKTGLGPGHLRQLKYYMASFGIAHGLLINFPRLQDFPDIEDDLQDGFNVEKLQGSKVVMDPNLRKRAPMLPEIHRVYNEQLQRNHSNEKEDGKTLSSHDDCSSDSK